MRAWASIVGVLFLSACATVPGPSPEARRELAATGAVRCAINYGNPVLARRNAASGELRGVAPALCMELATRLGVRPVLLGYDTVAKLLAGLKAGDWDVGFLALDPARAGEVAFTAPYMEVEVTYGVASSSDLRDAAQADRAGVRIAVQERNAADLFLSRTLKNATLVRVANNAAAFAALKSGAAEAWAANKQELLSTLEANPGYRALAGRFSTIDHAAAVPIARTRGAAYLRDFIESAKRSGAVARAIEENGVRGVVVAPAAS